MNPVNSTCFEEIRADCPFIMNQYQQEAEELLRQLPQGESENPLSSVEKTRRNFNRQRLIARQMEEIEREEPLPLPNDLPQQEKRKNNKCTQQDRNLMKIVYKNHPAREEFMKEALELLTISRSYLGSFYRKLVRNESIDLSVVKRGRKKVFRNEMVIEMVNIIKSDPTVTDAQIALKLREKFDGPLSRSTVQRVRNDKEAMSEAGLKPYTFKVATRRAPTAQSQENKLLRCEIVDKLTRLPSKYKVVYIDETHWEFCRKFSYAKSEKGSKALVSQEGRGYRMSAIMAMSADGPHYTLIHIGANVNRESFNAYFSHLVDSMKNEYVCFYMDNASIHHKESLMERISKPFHTIIFGAPNSPGIQLK